MLIDTISTLWSFELKIKKRLAKTSFEPLLKFCHDFITKCTNIYFMHRWGGGLVDCGSSLLKDSKTVGFLRNTGMDLPLESHIYPASFHRRAIDGSPAIQAI